MCTITDVVLIKFTQILKYSRMTKNRVKLTRFLCTTQNFTTLAARCYATRAHAFGHRTYNRTTGRRRTPRNIVRQNQSAAYNVLYNASAKKYAAKFQL